MCSPKPHIAAPAVAICLALSVLPGAAQATFRVDRVIDGETLVVSGVGTVRLLGVDVPRTFDAQRPGDESADPASVFLRRTLTDQAVRLEYDATRLDAAKRPLAYVYVSSGVLVNAELVRLGLGRVNTEAPFKLREEFERHERDAQSSRRGLWASLPPARPGQGPSSGTPRPAGAPVIR